MKFLLKDMLKLSKRKMLINDNPFNDIEINKHAHSMEIISRR
jgi:hypothetical protein